MASLADRFMPPPMADQRQQREDWPPQSPYRPSMADRRAAPDDEQLSQQWFFQFQQNLVLTVQAVHQLRIAMQGRMP
jgi:hypothetical protein